MAEMTFASKLYALFGGALLVSYLVMEHRGSVWFGSDERAQIPQEARGQRGYRTHVFWHTGFQGGK
ncbi:MAG: hypothetical protein HY791_19875 [Deltaproteobacteria bacterium]|nr:hypothetical protein [Deltaproteobacteria bacterium]